MPQILYPHSEINLLLLQPQVERPLNCEHISPNILSFSNAMLYISG